MHIKIKTTICKGFYDLGKEIDEARFCLQSPACCSTGSGLAGSFSALLLVPCNFRGQHTFTGMVSWPGPRRLSPPQGENQRLEHLGTFAGHMWHAIQDETRAAWICLAVLSFNPGSERSGESLEEILHLFRLLFSLLEYGDSSADLTKLLQGPPTCRVPGC